MGDDINAIIRVCPMPRDGESEAGEASKNFPEGPGLAPLWNEVPIAMVSNCTLQVWVPLHRGALQKQREKMNYQCGERYGPKTCPKSPETLFHRAPLNGVAVKGLIKLL